MSSTFPHLFEGSDIFSRHAELQKKFMAGTITPEETAEAQRLVDEAAKRAGYDSPKVYHGTPNFGFSQFSMDKVISGNLGRGFYFTPSKDYAAAHTQPVSKGQRIFDQKLQDEKKVYAVFLKSKNPYRLKLRDGMPAFLPPGTDAVFAYNDKFYELPPFDEKNLSEIVVFSPSRIKSADPFTEFDLRRRFKAPSNDIRESFLHLFDSVHKHSADGTVWFDPSDSELERAYKNTHGELRGTMLYNVIKDTWAFTDEDVLHETLARKCNWSSEDCLHFYVYPKEKLLSFSLNAYSRARGGDRYFDPFSEEGKQLEVNKFWCWKLTRGWKTRGLAFAKKLEEWATR